jgi:hypothetical protein
LEIGAEEQGLETEPQGWKDGETFHFVSLRREHEHASCFLCVAITVPYFSPLLRFRIIALIRARMTGWIRLFLRRLENIVAPAHKPVDRSRLMGMYLNSANAPLAATNSRATPTRERQDGKFAQMRRRS